MALTGALLSYVVVFMLLFPVWLLFSEMWSVLAGYQTPQLVGSVQGAKIINNLGNTVFYYMPDSMLTILYFALIIALFISALYESARPETIPIGLLFLIPLILITFPLSDFTHWFYEQPGFSNVIQYYQTSIYISDWSPFITTLFTLGYLVLTVTKKNQDGPMPSGATIVSG